MLLEHAAEDSPSLDLTPIIDMVFLLLIFFLVATTLHQSEREMKIALPQTSSATPLTKLLGEIIVNVTPDGSVIVSGRPMSLDALGQLIREALSQNPEQKVSVRGDREAKYAAIAAVLDACKNAGIAEPYLDTIPAR